MLKIPEAPDVDAVFARRIYLIILLSSSLWVALIILPPLLYSSGGAFSEVSSALYFAFSPVCHQESDRSFLINGAQLAVCSRCAMIYIGFVIGTAVYPLIRRLSNVNTPSLYLLLIPLAAVLADVFFDRAGILYNTFFTRSATGVVMGFGLSLFIIPGMIRFAYEVTTFFGSKARAGL